MYENEINLALARIMELREEWFDYPGPHMSNTALLTASYTQWALNEIIQELVRCSDIHPELSLKHFLKRMQAYWEKASTTEARMIFETAYDVANELVDVIY